MDYPIDVTHPAPESPLCVIDLPSDEFYQIHALFSMHPPPPSSNLGTKGPSNNQMTTTI